jgi:thioredoxin reductase/CRP-like cAMP-binding protein/Fe-S-cluster-containing hydrogenase component 2
LTAVPDAQNVLDVVIIGGGPAGLAAASQAARRGLSHVVLERGAALADTIQKYHRGKLVMATPGKLRLYPELRIPFAEGSREDVLAAFERGVRESAIDLRLRHEVTGVAGEKGRFAVSALDRSGSGTGEPPRVEFRGKAVVVAMGTQGNLRKLSDRRKKPAGAPPGRDLPFVIYQLDDPAAYVEKTVVIVGAGDSAIENALALARPELRNRVHLVYDREGFGNARTANRMAIERAITEKRVAFLPNTTIARLEDGGSVCRLFLEGAADTQIEAHQVICRLGADPPRDFLNAAGVAFRGRDPRERPERSIGFETNKPGLYVVGATGDADLIKKAMNEGFEVIERLCGQPVVPMDVEVLHQSIAVPLGSEGTTPADAVSGAVEHIRASVPLFSGVSPVQLRNLLFNDCEVLRPAPGTEIIGRKTFGSHLWIVLGGGVEVRVSVDGKQIVRRGVGALLGELNLFQDGYHSASVVAERDAILLRVPRNRLLQAASSAPSIRETLDVAFAFRKLGDLFEPHLSDAHREELRSVLVELARTAEVRTWTRGQEIFHEGDAPDGLYVIRRGSAAVTMDHGGKRTFLAFRPAGSIVGEMGVLGAGRRTATLVATAPAETVRYPQAEVVQLLACFPELAAPLRGLETTHLIENGAHIGRADTDDLLSLLRDAGAGEATNILLLDDGLCVRCNQCEAACAATHGGISRLDREAGRTYAGVHVPTTCRHCSNPLCMSDCPPDVIHRKPNGEISIDYDGCISCGNCVKNCPYGVIQMHPLRRPTLLERLFPRWAGVQATKEFPVKCDLCEGLGGIAACEASCPTGAVLRVGPATYVERVLGDR